MINNLIATTVRSLRENISSFENCPNYLIHYTSSMRYACFRYACLRYFYSRYASLRYAYLYYITCVMPTCVLPLCILFIYVIFLCVTSTCIMPLRYVTHFMPVLVCVSSLALCLPTLFLFAFCLFTLCFALRLLICVMPICHRDYSGDYISVNT